MSSSTSPCAPSSSQPKPEALLFKERGNEFYKKRSFKNAILFYSLAIRLDHTNPSFFANRAAAFYETGQYAGAAADCETAMTIMQPGDKLATKVAHRMAKCFYFMDKYPDCLAVLHTAETHTAETQRFMSAVEHYLHQCKSSERQTATEEDDLVVVVSREKVRRSLRRRRATIQPYEPYQIFSEDTPMSVLEPMPDKIAEKGLDLDYIKQRADNKDPIRVVLAGAGDPRHIFATLSHFDMLFSKVDDMQAPGDPALELIVCDQNPAVIARTMLIFDSLLAFCKRLVVKEELAPAPPDKPTFSKETLEEASYLSHLFFGYKLPKKFARSLSDSLKAAVSRERTRTDLLSWVDVPPKSWKKVQRVMNTWALRDRFPEEVMDRQIGDVLERRKPGSPFKNEELKARKRRAVMDELREISHAEEWRKLFYERHKEKGVVPADMGPKGYIEHLIKRMKERDEVVEPLCWPLRHTKQDREQFERTKKLIIPTLIRDRVLAGDAYDVNPTMMDPMNASLALLAGYKHPWRVAEQLTTVDPLKYDYYESCMSSTGPALTNGSSGSGRGSHGEQGSGEGEGKQASASGNKGRKNKGEQKKGGGKVEGSKDDDGGEEGDSGDDNGGGGGRDEAVSLCEDMYHFWRFLSVRTQRCLATKRVKLKFVVDDAVTHFRNPISNDPHAAPKLDRVVISSVLSSSDYLEILSTFEPLVRRSRLGGIFCVADMNSVAFFTCVRQMLQGFLCVDEGYLDVVLQKLFNVRLVTTQVHAPHVFIPADRRERWWRLSDWPEGVKERLRVFDNPIRQLAELRTTKRGNIKGSNNTDVSSNTAANEGEGGAEAEAGLGSDGGTSKTGSRSGGKGDSGDKKRATKNSSNGGNSKEGKGSNKRKTQGSGAKGTAKQQKDGKDGNDKTGSGSKGKGRGSGGGGGGGHGAKAQGSSAKCRDEPANTRNSNEHAVGEEKGNGGEHDRAETEELAALVGEAVEALQLPGIHGYFSQQTTTNFLLHILLNCTAPSSFILSCNLASWFHFVAKLCVEGRVPRHWVATLVDNIVGHPHVINTTALPFNGSTLGVGPTNKLSMRPIVTEFRALLLLWLGKVPCVSTLPSVASEQLVRVFVRFGDMGELSVEDHRAALALVVYKGPKADSNEDLSEKLKSAVVDAFEDIHPPDASQASSSSSPPSPSASAQGSGKADDGKGDGAKKAKQVTSSEKASSSSPSATSASKGKESLSEQPKVKLGLGHEPSQPAHPAGAADSPIHLFSCLSYWDRAASCIMTYSAYEEFHTTDAFELCLARADDLMVLCRGGVFEGRNMRAPYTGHEDFLSPVLS